MRQTEKRDRVRQTGNASTLFILGPEISKTQHVGNACEESAGVWWMEASSLWLLCSERVIRPTLTLFLHQKSCPYEMDLPGKQCKLTTTRF